MGNTRLHTYALEKLFGPVKGHIIQQDKKIRIVHIKDKKGISRTLGVVRFVHVNNTLIKNAHSKILAGGLLGKTLHDFRIDFDKEIIGFLQVQLSDWLKKDFNTKGDISTVFYSKIIIRSASLSNGESIYSEIIEVVPPELKDLSVDKTKYLNKIDKNLRSLLNIVDLKEIKIIKKI